MSFLHRYVVLLLLLLLLLVLLLLLLVSFVVLSAFHYLCRGARLWMGAGSRLLKAGTTPLLHDDDEHAIIVVSTKVCPTAFLIISIYLYF